MEGTTPTTHGKLKAAFIWQEKDAVPFGNKSLIETTGTFQKTPDVPESQKIPPFSFFREEDIERARRRAQTWQDEYHSDGANEKALEKTISKFISAMNFAPQDAAFYKYTFALFLNHDDSDTAKLFRKEVPSLPQQEPDKFAFASLDTIFLEGERQINWWREDPMLNSHHWNWHTVFPSGGYGPNHTRKDRQGELFIYMHRQLIARYDAERRAVSLPPVYPFGWHDFRQPINHSYDSHLIKFAPRSGGTGMADFVDRGVIPYRPTSIYDLECWRDRLFKSILKGYFKKPTKKTQKFTSTENQEKGKSDAGLISDEKDWITIDSLGEVVECNAYHSHNRPYYGNLHNMGHNILAWNHDPRRELQSNPGVMGDVIAALRDPVFWEWHKHVDEYGFRWEETQPVIPLEPDAPDGLEVASVNLFLGKLIPGEKKICGYDETPTSELKTVMIKDKFFYGATSALGGATVNDPVTGRGKEETEFEMYRLFYRPFKYGITLQHSERKSKESVVIRIFLVPKEDVEDRRKWIEMDKFLADLSGKSTYIERRSEFSSILQEARQESWPDGWDTDDSKVNDPLTYCKCGLPRNLLLPRGTNLGMPFVLLTLVTRWKGKAEESLPKCCEKLSSYCGTRNGNIPDPEPLGYPFHQRFPPYDRETEKGGVVGTLKELKNANLKEFTIKWEGYYKGPNEV